MSAVLRIRQQDRIDGCYPMRLRLLRPSEPEPEAQVHTDFAPSRQE